MRKKILLSGTAKQKYFNKATRNCVNNAKLFIFQPLILNFRNSTECGIKNYFNNTQKGDT